MRPIPTAPCLGLVHQFEQGPGGGFAATRYEDPDGYPTIGWGHKLIGPADPLWDVTLTASEADAEAIQDLTISAKGVCAALPSVDALTPGQYAALIDFAFNLGVGAFAGSTLCLYVRTGAFHLVPDQFRLWVHGRVNGVETVLPGLVRRRNAEIAVWLA